MPPSPALVRFLRFLRFVPPPAPAPRSLRIPASKRPYHPPRTSTPLRPSPVLSQSPCFPRSARYESAASHPAAPPSAATTAPESRLDRDQVPQYEMTFTCKQCSTRSSHRISKQGYHQGTVLISCPACKNRHLISDHLKIFSDKPVTVEDIVREKGQLVKRGSLSADGDVEFWDDGSTSPRSSNFIPNSTVRGDPDAETARLTQSPASPEAAKNRLAQTPSECMA